MHRVNFIHPPGFKDRTQHKKIEKAALPKKVIIPLAQHTGVASEPVVNIVDTVKRGSLIACSKGFISSNIHSSISGKVTAIEECPHPVIGAFKAIVVESDGEDRGAFSGVPRDVSNLSREEIINIVKEAGMVGLGGAAFPTHVKLMPPSEKKINTLIIN